MWIEPNHLRNMLNNLSSHCDYNPNCKIPVINVDFTAQFEVGYQWSYTKTTYLMQHFAGYLAVTFLYVQYYCIVSKSPML